MNPGEYEVMARVEETHWWYRGLRDAISGVLTTPRLALRDAPRVLDAGCGTGGNLQHLSAMFRPSYLGGFDHSDEALALARSKVPGADIYRSDICAPELHAENLDLIISMDVIYIPGVDRALSGLRQLVAALRPGGLFIINLPAYNWLYSDHDVAIHTSERYTRSRVRKLLEDLELSVAVLSYRMCLLFPAVVLARVPGMLRARSGGSSGHSDLHIVPGPIANRLCYGTLAAESYLIARGICLPWGSSVFAVGRKP